MLSSTAVPAKEGAGKSLYTHVQDGLVSASSFWDPRLHASPLLGQQDSMFVDGYGSPAVDFLQPQPALLSPHVPVTGFVILFLSEKMYFGHRCSQNEGTEVSESLSSKGWTKASAMP